MATINPVKGDLLAGVAGQSSDVLNAQEAALVTGDAPAQWVARNDGKRLAAR